uniref:Uncharacterized protein n=1 Tax=Octopus bimaculoides TaxID=37653 RepID=A0A0L8HGT5_OCTBM
MWVVLDLFCLCDRSMSFKAYIVCLNTSLLYVRDINSNSKQHSCLQESIIYSSHNTHTQLFLSKTP